MRYFKYWAFFIGLISISLLSYSCSEEVSVSTCADGILNGDEDEVDCGCNSICGFCPTCNDGIQNGDELGVDCGGSCITNPCPEGIQGKWVSKDFDLSALALLDTIANIDMDFGIPDTLRVEIQDTVCVADTIISGADTTTMLVQSIVTDSVDQLTWTDLYQIEVTDSSGVVVLSSGSYTQLDTEFENIWELTLNQTIPDTLSIMGLFRVNQDRAIYEMVQSDPCIDFVPPRSSLGFGSTIPLDVDCSTVDFNEVMPDSLYLDNIISFQRKN